MKKPNLSRRTLYGIFTISGFSGLIYESIWSHYLKLFLGHAAYAQTLVLAIFMGGMALGAWLVARSSTKIRNLLVAYAAVEMLTGLIALIFHRVYVGATALAFDSVIPSLDSGWSIAVFKWSLAAGLILPQSVLLGTTFPLISGGVIRRFPERSGETLAMLYFTNSLGAALGVLASGFVLIEKVGLPGTVMTAGVLNVLLAILVWVLARDESAFPARPETQVSNGSAVARWIFIAAFLAGLAAFVYEIAWIRMLSLVLGSSTHAFELMLSAFILGLAFGGYWVRRRIASYASAPRALAIMFSLMAILAVLTLPAYGFSFDVMAAALHMFSRTDPGYFGFNVASHAIAAALMIPTTLIAGMTLPLMTHFLMHAGAGEEAIGKTYAANTVGAIVGVLIAVHMLLPNIGTKGAVVFGALLQLSVAGLLLSREIRAQQTRFSRMALGCSILIVALVAITVRLDPMRMASAVYRDGLATLPPDFRVTFLRDGKTATITLTQQGPNVAIATNGKPDAAVNMEKGGVPTVDEITMTMLGALPLVMHAQPKRVANIGVGSGLTSHIVLTSPTVESLDSIEIEPAIVEAARRGFQPRVSKLFNDPRSHIHLEDAKTFFAATKQPYDVIISEPSNPWVSGVASLFSTEFYSQVKHYLRHDGLLVQWVQIYETDMTVVASIVKAMSPHFADYAIYNTDDTDILIVASADKPLPATRGAAISGALADELHKVGIDSISDIDLRRIGSKRSLDALFASYPVPPNSDYFPFVDLTAPRMRFLQRDATKLSEMRLHGLPFLELLGEPALAPATVRALPGQFFARQGLVQQALAVRAALVTGDFHDLPIPVAENVLTVHMSAAKCAKPGATAIWLGAVRSLAGRTTPHLSAGDLIPIWQVIRQSDCYPLADGLQRNWLDFLEAGAARDRVGIASHGIEILKQEQTIGPDVRAEILVAVGIVQLGDHDPRSALKLLLDHQALIDRGRDIDLGIRLVEALAIARISRPN